MLKIGGIVVLLAICFEGTAQLSPVRQALNRMQKGKWKSAEESLRKSLLKDTLNPEAKLIFSEFYFFNENPSHNIDSAYRYANRAMRDYSAISPREKDRLKRFPLDSAILTGQRRKIDSVAFEQAKQINTEKSYQDFLTRFVDAREHPVAVELRNEVAFVDALKVNTYQSFLDYLTKYPASARTGAARQRYEKLLFENKTRDGTLQGFEAFYRTYPLSPYRNVAEKNIFEITTASGRPSSFMAFLTEYPSASFRSRAEAILYHLLKEEDAPEVFITLTDSLKQVQQAEQVYWVPVLRNGKFGFIDQRGNETIGPQFDNLPAEYLCGNLKADFLTVAGGIISRSGRWIVKGPVTEAVDLGSGFLKIKKGNCIQLVHKSGFVLPGACYEDGKLLARNFVAVKDRMKWGLISLTGRILMSPQYDDIGAIDGLIIFIRNGKKMIVTVDQVSALLEKSTLPSSLVFDDVQRLALGNYLVRNATLEGVLDGSLEFTIELNRQRITKVQNGWMLERDGKYFLTGLPEKMAGKGFGNVQFYGNWIKLQPESDPGIPGQDFQLYDLTKKKIVNDRLDSLWFENELAFAWKNDSLKVYLSSGFVLDFAAGTNVNFMKSADSTEYFFVAEKNKKIVFDAVTGAKLFAYDFDEIECIGNAVFLVSQGNKKGLVTETGKVILPTEYAAIVPAGKGIVSLLKDKKFGMYHLQTKKLLKPVYDRNVSLISANFLAAYMDGAYGFIGWDSKPKSKFEFEEVRPWNDSSALVRKNFRWMIYNVHSARVVLDKIKDYREVSDFSGEKVVIVHQDLFYGVVSNKRGEIIHANFSDIVNVGSEEDPMYFAEKNVEEAGISVVIYYDKNGKLLRKQAYEEEEYEKIYCTK